MVRKFIASGTRCWRTERVMGHNLHLYKQQALLLGWLFMRERDTNAASCASGVGQRSFCAAIRSRRTDGQTDCGFPGDAASHNTPLGLQHPRRRCTTLMTLPSRTAATCRCHISPAAHPPIQMHYAGFRTAHTYILQQLPPHLVPCAFCLMIQHLGRATIYLSTPRPVMESNRRLRSSRNCPLTSYKKRFIYFLMPIY